MSIETPPRAAHLPGIQALRGLAAMLVVLSHIYSMEIKHSPDQLLGAWSVYGGIGVDLFFVISGFIMVHVTRNIARGPASAGTFLLRRAGRIYPLYWLVTLAVLAVYLYKPEIVFSGIDRRPEIINSLTLWPHYRPPLLAVGWTLSFEVMFYIVFAVALLFPRRYLKWYLALWAAVILIAQVPLWSVWLAPRPLPALISAPITLEFILGAALALWLPKLTVSAAQGRTLVIIGVLTGAFAVTVLSLNDEQILNSFAVRTAIFAGPAGLIVFGTAALDQSGRAVSKALQALGDWSYSIYLTHILTLSVLGQIWKIFARPGLTDNITMLIVFTAATIITGGIVYKLVERPLTLGFQTLINRS